MATELKTYLTGLTEDTAPAIAADFVMTYDTSAAALKKAKPSALKGYAVYVAQLTQTGTAAPTATILENTIGAIVWTRTSAGLYAGTLTGAFPTLRTAIPTSVIHTTVSTPAKVYRASDNVVNVTTALDGELSSTLAAAIEIRVYYA